MATNIKARRKLSDLYKKGVEVRFGPGPDGMPVGKIGPFLDSDGKPVPPGADDVCMWIQPPSPLQREMALRDAQASRAGALVRAKRDENSEEHLTVMAFLADMSDDTLIEYVLIAQQDQRRQEATREILGLEEWADITAYQDAMRKFEENETPEDDPEYAALLELDQKFGDQVSAREAELTDASRDVLKMLQRPAVEKKALDKRAEIIGSQAFMQEYERQMMFYSVRDVDNAALLFFESARELAEQPDEVRNLIADALTPFLSDGAEAKNSQGAVSGLESSEPPSKPETSEASIPQEANA